MRLLSSLVGVAIVAFTAAPIARQGLENIRRSPDRFSMRVVATGLASPWELAWGPDQHLWVTERVGKRVLRVNPESGATATLVTVSDVVQTVAQDGLLGLAFHPDFLRGTGNDHVFLALTYDASPGADVALRMAIRRYRYDSSSQTLSDAVTVLPDLPAHDDHLGGRLVVGLDRKLYLGIGDQGSNWLGNRCRPNRAQDLPTVADVSARNWSTYAGKILRIDLDGAIPADNPVINGVRSHVFSYGHRNPLGLVVGPEGRLYESEHGPDTDDEVNLISAGMNYGWPFVAGFRDDKAYVWANWSASSPTPCSALTGDGPPPASVARQAETAWNHPQLTPPLRTFFTWDIVPGAAQSGGTIAPGGLDMHVAGRGVPGWNDSLLVLSMVRGVVYRVPLAPGGRSVQEPPVEVFKTTNRYRDIAIHPTQRVFYFATDPSGRSADETGAPTQKLANPGSILEFSYVEP
jgi:PQQ-dependent dehydrogenase (s-GDH family)